MHARRWRPAAIAIAIGILSMPTAASAFCRTTTVRAPPDRNPVLDGCWGSGLPLYHPTACLPYRLLVKESSVLSNAVLADMLARAFAAWTAPNPRCVPGIVGFELTASTAPVIVAYRPGERTSNLVGVPPTWAEDPDTKSLSTLVYKPDTGEVLGVDTEINPNVPWSVNDPPSAGAVDLQSVITHEVGHMLGIDHSAVPDSVMFNRIEPGEARQRVLADDDHAAICAIYPNAGQRLTANGLIPATACTLTTGNPEQGCADAHITHGCSAAHGGPAGSDLAALVALGGIAALRRLRRTAKKR